MAAFAHYIGIDYSGANTPSSCVKGRRKYWNWRGVAEWLVELVEQISEDRPTLVGIDHGFSFPLRYFEVHRLKPDWPAFLDDFQHYWPTDEDIYVNFVRDGTVGNGAGRMGNPRWRRLTEERAGSAKSVFLFDVQGSVPAGRSAVVEVYPSLWSRNFARGERNGDQRDAYSAAAWMRRAALNESLAAFLNPSLATPERAVAQVEGGSSE